MSSKLICRNCRDLFKSIGFEFELFASSPPITPDSVCYFCKKKVYPGYVDWATDGVPVKIYKQDESDLDVIDF